MAANASRRRRSVHHFTDTFRCHSRESIAAAEAHRMHALQEHLHYYLREAWRLPKILSWNSMLLIPLALRLSLVG